MLIVGSDLGAPTTVDIVCVIVIYMKQARLPWAMGSLDGNAAETTNWRLKSHSAWQDDPQWKSCVSRLSKFSGKLKVIELCGGVGTAFIALSLLLPSACVELAGHWDTDSDLAAYLNRVHPTSSVIHLGGIAGDIKQWSIDDIAFGHIIVAGPPCPPWSKLGVRKSFEDVRASVFWRVIDIVMHQAKHGFLGMFILENVEGITHKSSGASEPPSTIIMKELREGLTDRWVVGIHLLNALSFGLPQSRSRAFIVGHRIDLFGNDVELPVNFERTVPLHHFVDIHDLHQVESNTGMQDKNITDWKQFYESRITDTTCKGSFAVFDVSRTPSNRTSWNARGNVDMVECLTASGPNLHIMSLGDGDSRHLTIDRRIRGHERARLQGFPPSICDMVSDNTASKRIFGNAMAVPVIGSMLASEIIALCDHSKPSDLTEWLCAGDGMPEARDTPEQQAIAMSGIAASSGSDSRPASDILPMSPLSKRRCVRQAYSNTLVYYYDCYSISYGL